MTEQQHLTAAIVPQPPERQDYIVLEDGRHLAWCEWGPIHGRPVLFCTGAGMSGNLGFAGASLVDLGARLISIDRPGLSRSDEDPRGTLLSWADDVAELVRQRELRDAVAVGFSQGAPFALQLASAGLVRAVAVVAGQDDFNHPRTFEKLDPQVIAMINSLRNDPEAFKGTVGAANPDWLWSMIMSMSSEQDQQAFGGEPFASAYRRSLEEGFSQGSSGYVRDLVNTWRPWPFRLEDLRVPVDLWYGRRDTSSVHSPDFGETMATRTPRARLFIESEEGSSLLWTKGEEILREVLGL
jgi:pimeloyl-ACP methyl ester carboxylesterase